MMRIRPQARDTLRSRDIWAAIEHNEETAAIDEKQAIEPPRFHIGRVDSTGRLLKKSGDRYSEIPWNKSDKPDRAFEKLVNSVWEQIEEANPNPKLERIFDYYLRMVWQLALAVPLPYISGHPFDMPVSGWAKTFEISNKRKGSAKEISGLLDVDDYLSSQSDIESEMIESMCTLLESARYDIDVYRKWITV
jgi:hypothetical protein